jgi:hypothetical protein
MTCDLHPNPRPFRFRLFGPIQEKREKRQAHDAWLEMKL